MIEGWHNDDYLVLFEDQNEALRITELYGIGVYLPGYLVVGLRGWDDFVLTDAHGQCFRVPTVPLDAKYLDAFDFQVDLAAIQPDARFTGKIKWYVKPIVFGGSPTAEENIAWISLEKHAEFVRWWNKLYREVSAGNTTT